MPWVNCIITRLVYTNANLVIYSTIVLERRERKEQFVCIGLAGVILFSLSAENENLIQCG